MRLNAKRPTIYTHEGAVAKHVNPTAELQRSVMACMLWEDTFYEDGESIADRIKSLVPLVPAKDVSLIAFRARGEQKLRHVPLLLAREMARYESHKYLVADTLAAVIQRPDELTEFLAIYWKDGKQPLSAQVKKGLGRAFQKFNEYSLAKYNRDEAIKLRDVLFLCHATPKDLEQADTWRKLIGGFCSFCNLPIDKCQNFKGRRVKHECIEAKLMVPDTWETELSAGKGEHKLFSWVRLLKENKLGALALLRNLRNMTNEGVPEDLIREALRNADPSRVLPFRYISAAKYAPQFEPELEDMMFRSINPDMKLKGKTCLLIDGSGSMFGATVSAKSEIDRFEAACGLAMITREVCETVDILVFSERGYTVPPRRGFALRDAVRSKAERRGTMTDQAIRGANARGYDRLILITDEQSHTAYPDPLSGTKAYCINVATYKNGIGYGRWTHIDGWSEAVLSYIAAVESEL